MNTPIYFAPATFACKHFTDPNGATDERIVALSPVRINGNEETEIKVSYGCNLWKSCYNCECQYSYSKNRNGDFNPGRTDVGKY